MCSVWDSELGCGTLPVRELLIFDSVGKVLPSNKYVVIKFGAGAEEKPTLLCL